MKFEIPSDSPEEYRTYLQAYYAEKQSEIRSRLLEFKAVPSSDYFYELCFCLCTPQSKARHALQAVEQLKARRFQEEGGAVVDILSNREHYIRFHNVKSERLQELRRVFIRAGEVLESSVSAVEKRQWLVRNINGIGMKEASHFLRNIGLQGLAILDRHTLKHLHYAGVINSSATPSTMKRYEQIEQKWLKYCELEAISIEEMDLVFWSLEAGEILK